MLGFTVELERLTRQINGETEEISLRATTVYRREDGAWKVTIGTATASSPSKSTQRADAERVKRLPTDSDGLTVRVSWRPSRPPEPTAFVSREAGHNRSSSE
jgi:hypothetical protein